MKLFLATFLSLSLVTSFAGATSKMNLKKSMFIAAVVQGESGLEIWLNPRQVWEKEGYFADSYSEEESLEASRITDLVNLCGMAESTYEPCLPGRMIGEVIADLALAGVEVPADFQAMAEGELADYTDLSVRFESFAAVVPNQTMAKVLNTDICARAALVSVKENILDQQAMKDGVDLPESVSVSFLNKVATDKISGQETYSVGVVVGVDDPTVNSLVQTSRKGNQCQAKAPYSAAL